MAQSETTWGQRPSSWEPRTQQGEQQWPSNQQKTSTAGRVSFWVAAGFSWVVWAFSVAAAAHDEWVVASSQAFSSTEGLEAGNTNLLRVCDEADSLEFNNVATLCSSYRGFTATQFVATVISSIAAGLLTMAFFRPAVAGCAPVKHLGVASGCILILHILFQVVAVIMAHRVVEEYEFLWDRFGIDTSSTFGLDFKVGLTCWLGVAGVALALFTSVCLFVTVRYAGDGPFVCACCKGERGRVKSAQVQEDVNA